MSTTIAIEAVTDVLRTILVDAISDASVTVSTKPLNDARPNNKPSQVNVFLYRVEHNAALRNSNLPARPNQASVGGFPLALDLYYMLTFYGNGDDEKDGHRLLGITMQTLEYYTSLQPDDLEAIMASALVHEQIERIRITPQDLSLEDISRIWTMTQSPYRLSIGYQLSAVLIENPIPKVDALPVRERNIVVAPNTDLSARGNYPSLLAADLPDMQQGMLLGDTVTLRGFNLDGETVTLVLETTHWNNALEIPIPELDRTDTTLTFTVDNGLTDWVAGTYSIYAVVTRSEGRIYQTKPIIVPLLPVMTLDDQTITRQGNGSANIRFDLTPELGAEQNAALLIAGRLVPIAQGDQNPVNVTVEDAPLGTFALRVRVDDVTSMVIDTASETLEYDESIKVTIS